MFIYNVEVDDSFAQPLLPDCAERLLDSHVGFQQRLINTAVSRDGVIEIGKPGDIGHAVGLHRQAGNATVPGPGSRKKRSVLVISLSVLWLGCGLSDAGAAHEHLGLLSLINNLRNGEFF
jgi:hypothetical protein